MRRTPWSRCRRSAPWAPCKTCSRHCPTRSASRWCAGWRTGRPVACAELYDSVSKSTASHHFKVLREAGLTERVTLGGQTHQRLRLDDVEAAYPGVVSSIVAASRH